MISHYSKTVCALRCNILAPLPPCYRASLRRSLFTSVGSNRYATADKTPSGIEFKQKWIFGATALLLGVATATAAAYENRRITSLSTTLTFTTLCEDGEISTDKNDDPDSPGPHNDFGAVAVENDPYENLPKVDEETTCDICNTFRKGPCRKYWRKTERCWKQGDSDKCLPYSTPFINCSMYYRNLYVLVMLENFQEYITAMENDAKSVAVRQFSDDSNDDTVPYVLVDWNPWNEFNKDFGPSFSQTIPSSPSDVHSNKKNPLWKRLPTDTEPILVPCNVIIPTRFASLKDERKLMHLKIAYVTDQDGFVVGKYFKPSKFSSDEDSDSGGENIPSEASEPSKGDASESSTASNRSIGDDDGISEDANAEISCILLPGETKSIVVTAYYCDTINLDSDEAEEDAIVYKKEYDLYKMLVA
jgi:hypothetical protein